MGLGAVVVGIAALALLVWAGVIINARRARPSVEEEPPANLTPFLNDDELESRRISKVLLYALIASAVLALVVPIYYLSESDRQAEASEAVEELYIEEGEHWYEVFSCIECHGAGGVGGGVAFVEPRSGLETTWLAPSLNDIFYRYEEDEVLYWLRFGRAGTPMPAIGLEGGGAATEQELDQLIAYLRSIQIPQEEAFAQVENRVSIAVDRFLSAEETAQAALEEQQQLVDTLRLFPDVFTAVETIPAQIEELLSSDGTCTDAAAALVGRPCGDAGQDSDRDGIADSAELALNDLLVEFATTAEPVLTAEERAALASVYDAIEAASELDVDPLIFDPSNRFSTVDAAGDPVADLDRLEQTLTELDIIFITLRVTATNNETFVTKELAGVEFLEESVAEQRWEVDISALADEAFGGDEDLALRAVGLFNAYCARCHTAGYSAGVPFETTPGSGAWAWSLLDGRSVRQFPDPDDHFDFIVNGSERAVNYGVNGLGNGFMPGFGTVLSEEDIRAIIAYERAM